MKLIKCYLTNTGWYKNASSNSKPVGILWHDTDGGNTNIKRYVQPMETDANYNELIDIIGKNPYNNDWNHSGRDAGVNAFIGKIADGSIATVQTGPWEKTPYGCGAGSLGSCNGYDLTSGTRKWTGTHWIQFEICDDKYKDKKYFDQVYKEACELTAYLCKLYDIDPMGTVDFCGIKVPTITCHGEATQLKVGGSHEDVYKWFRALGLPQNMEQVRRDVAALMGIDTEVFAIGDVVKIKQGVTTYANGKTMPDWVKRAKLYVRLFVDSDKVKISTLEEGAITGTVYLTDIEFYETKEDTVVETPAPKEETEVKEPELEIKPETPKEEPKKEEPVKEETVEDKEQIDKEIIDDIDDVLSEQEKGMIDNLLVLLKNFLYKLVALFKKK